MSRIEGADEHARLPLPPGTETTRANPNARSAALLVVLGAIVSVVTIWRLWAEKGTTRYLTTTDKSGVPLPFRYYRFDGDLAIVLLVALPCLVALVVAVVKNRGRRRSGGPIVAVLVLATVAVIGGTLVLIRSSPSGKCQACVDSTGLCAIPSGSITGGGGFVHYDPVPCPAEYQQGALYKSRVADQRAVALIILGGGSVLVAVALLLLGRNANRGFDEDH